MLEFISLNLSRSTHETIFALLSRPTSKVSFTSRSFRSNRCGHKQWVRYGSSVQMNSYRFARSIRPCLISLTHSNLRGIPDFGVDQLTTKVTTNPPVFTDVAGTSGGLYKTADGSSSLFDNRRRLVRTRRAVYRLNRASRQLHSEHKFPAFAAGINRRAAIPITALLVLKLPTDLVFASVVRSQSRRPDT